MRYAGLVYFLLMLLTVAAQGAQPIPTVKFTPVIKVYECPPVFQHKGECVVSEKKLEQVKIWLSMSVAEQTMGSWSHQEASPVPATFHVIVLRGLTGNTSEYSVSAEAGLTGMPLPFANARTEFNDHTLPRNFGVASAPIEKDGKKYITELRLEDFHGRIVPAKK